MKFTTASVTALKRPAHKDDHVEWDPSLPGFGVRLRGDAKTWLIQYRFGLQQRRESLGDVRQMKLEDARKAARQRFAKLRLGIDPAAERAKARAEANATKLTVGNAVERYLDAKADVLRPGTYNQAKLHVTGNRLPIVLSIASGARTWRHGYRNSSRHTAAPLPRGRALICRRCMCGR
jgi:hypothetical protein